MRVSRPLKHRTLVIVFAAAILIFGGLELFSWHNNINLFPTEAGTSPSTTAQQVDAAPEVTYLEVIDGCGPYRDTGVCVNMRSGPGLDYPVILKLRTGVVLKVASTTLVGDRVWYKIAVDPSLVHLERVTSDWYIAADPESILAITDLEDETLTKQSPKTDKYILVNLADETLDAYEGDTLFLHVPISTGLDDTPTQQGTYYVFKKTPSRYMQGPIPGGTDQYYDLPGVPWNLYFSSDGKVVHGAYWHDHFGEPWSHGCVNVSPQIAKALYMWAPVGTKVIVQTH